MKSMYLYEDNYCVFKLDEENNEVHYADANMTHIPMSFSVGSFIANKYSKSICHGCKLLDMLYAIRKNRK